MTTPALLVVAHGSSNPAAARALAGLVTRICAAARGIEVRLSYVDHTGPSVSSALSGYVDAGRDVVVVPLLLSPAAHARGDIPAVIRAARRDGTGRQDGTVGQDAASGGAQGGVARLRYARVLGPHPLLLSALERRLAEAGVGRSSALVLAAAGSTDPDANAEVARMARLLWEWRGGVAPVEPAFASATAPSVDTAIVRLRLLGHTEVAVASYFLAPGRLPDMVAAQASGLPVTAPLADTDEVARLVVERYAEALAGTVAANCDTCVYRVPWPGHEHRVGAPQRVHPHPGDTSVRAVG